MQNAESKGYFSYLPISFFGSVMGLSASCVMWSLTPNVLDKYYHLPNSPQSHAPFVETAVSFIAHFSVYLSYFFGILALIAFIALCVAYGLKLITSFQSVKQEFLNPLTRPFFGTFGIACLLLPIVLMIGLDSLIHSFDLWEESAASLIMFFRILALILWCFGALFMLVFGVHIVSFWIAHKHEMSHITPAWIIPVVGLLDIPLALPYIFGHLSALTIFLVVFCVSVGLFFAVILTPLILARIIFFEKLPDKLTPTLVILLASFGVGASAWGVLGAGIGFEIALFCIGLFFFFALLPQVFKAYKCCPFRSSWWAISFPLVALGIAMLKVADGISAFFYYNGDFIVYIILGFVGFITCVILWLIYRTLRGILRGELQNLS